MEFVKMDRNVAHNGHALSPCIHVTENGEIPEVEFPKKGKIAKK